MAEKKYYWLKLKNTYFNHISQKKMKRQEHGKEMQVIYLRMMLHSIDSEGYIYYQGVYDTLAEELAEEFDEPAELIKSTIEYLNNNKLITLDDEENSCYLPEAVECLGSETEAAVRMRNKRNERKTNNVQKCSESVQGSSKSSKAKNKPKRSTKNENKTEEDNALDLLTAEEQKKMVDEMIGKLTS